MVSLGWDDLLSVPTMGLYTAQKQLGGVDITDLGEGMKDFSNVGKNKFQPTPYDVQPAYWGGDPNAATDYYNIGKAGLGASNADASWASQQSRNMDPMAWENQELSDREATTAGYHQEGALNLALQGALGNQPSEAAYQLQAGLDQSMAQQQALSGGARGAAAIANAQGNMGANMANMQQQAFTEAGRLRAQEIANYTGMYGGLAGQKREQDLGRLGMGNQMSQFNANNTTQRQLGFLGAANDSRRTGQGWYGQMGQPYGQQLQADLETQQQKQGAYNTSLGLGASIAQSNADQAGAMRDRFAGWAIQGGQTAVSAGAGQGKP
jgi:hypothetical protein